MTAPDEHPDGAHDGEPAVAAIGQACALQLGPHWKTEGRLTLGPGMVTIVNGTGEGWETGLRELGCETAWLDDNTIAIKAPRSS